MSIDTQIYTTIDYDKNGKQMGTLDVPQSTNTSGWRTQYLPITVVKNGSGPTALLFGGNHGDEYEGPVALMKLARSLQPAQVQGRVIIVPMLNRPAIEAGTRLSPIDGMNMNRAFPGERNGTITSVIAHYVTQALFPLADVVVDIHSGGRSAHMLASVNMHHVPDTQQMQSMLAAGLAWGAPYVFIYRDVGGEGLLPGYAEKLGKLTLGTEIGSAAQFGAEMVAIAERGVKNVLRHVGILEGAVEAPAVPPEVVGATELGDYVMAPVSGIFEPFHEMGVWLEAGQPLGQIHSVEEPFREPVPVPALTSGMLISRRAFPLTRQGDCVATLVRPFSLA
ncbi:MAG: succinylglutamate desuccinylase/aspartoacylase family protein [Anaerolineae bacterium]|nr:succinylglutamate desuccinylase/aspartoacylase family protein [Anaerolineae bacterium]